MAWERRARAREGCGWLGFHARQARVQDDHEVFSRGCVRVRLAFSGGEALLPARAPVVVVPYRITVSGVLADVGLSSEPLAPRFPAPSIPTFFMPASFRVSLTNPTFPVIHSAQASPCLPPWRLASPLWAVVLWS